MNCYKISKYLYMRSKNMKILITIATILHQHLNYLSNQHKHILPLLSAYSGSLERPIRNSSASARACYLFAWWLRGRARARKRRRGGGASRAKKPGALETTATASSRRVAELPRLARRCRWSRWLMAARVSLSLEKIVFPLVGGW